MNSNIQTKLFTEKETPPIGNVPLGDCAYTSDVYLMDCMELMAQYPDNYFDLAVVDPPYGIDVANWDSIFNRPNKEYFDELFRVSKNQIIWGGNYFTDKLPITESWICWHKKPFLKQQAHFELAWTSFNQKPKIIEYTYAGNCEGLVNLKVNYDKKSIHPTQKPENLYSIIFKNYATEGMKILDTHLGSGSSRISANKANLHFTGCEIDKEYFDKSQKRYDDFVSQVRLF